MEKSMDWIIIEEQRHGEFDYRLYDKAYNINHSKDCYIQDISWDVVVVDEKTIYSAIISYIRDSEDIEITPRRLKTSVWFESVLSSSKESFDEDLKNKIANVTRMNNYSVKNITHRVINVNDETKYIAVITFVSNGN